MPNMMSAAWEWLCYHWAWRRRAAYRAGYEEGYRIGHGEGEIAGLQEAWRQFNEGK
tara:strand:+ start:981 stop:1148 length:168 start_codon:yes stop_codon:yes gene_type:complete